MSILLNLNLDLPRAIVEMRVAREVRKVKIPPKIHSAACVHFIFHYSYSLYEPKDIVLSEYKGGLEKAIIKNSTLLVQLNDAFCKTHPWIVKKVCTRSAHAAVSNVSADTVLKKELNEKKQGTFILILLT